MSLDGFPRRTLRGDRVIHRIHRAGRSPWWFSADGTGRFDPVGTGQGACYLAERPVGAWIEVFRKSMLLAEGDVHTRTLTSLRLGRDVRLADLTSRRALRFGVTATLGAGADYAPSQAFAAAAVGAGFAGIRYLLRHDPAQKIYGFALFGPPGAPDPADPAWPAGASAGLMTDAVFDEAVRQFGYRVLPSP